MKKDNEDWRTEEIKYAIAKRRKKGLEPTPKRKSSAKSLSVLVSEALGNKLNEIADDLSGRTYGEKIADKLVKDALTGKLPAQVVSKLFESSGSTQDPAVRRPLSDKSTEELKYYVQHGRWPSSADGEHSACFGTALRAKDKK